MCVSRDSTFQHRMAGGQESISNILLAARFSCQYNVLNEPPTTGGTIVFSLRIIQMDRLFRWRWTLFNGEGSYFDKDDQGEGLEGIANPSEFTF